MGVTHLPPRRRTHITRKEHNRQLAFCFITSLVMLGVLVLVTLAFGQSGAAHPFPFKTLEDLTTGTSAWVRAGLVEMRQCPGAEAVIAKFQFTSGAGSVWVVYTDGTLFAAAYFPPGSTPPVVIVEGHVENGQLVVERNVAYDPATHRPCNRWQQQSAGGSDGC